MEKEVKLKALETVSLSDSVRKLVNSGGLKALKEAAKVMRNLALTALWTVKDRPDKSFQEIAAHNGRRIARQVSEVNTKQEKQLREVGNYIEAVRLAMQGHGTIEENLKNAAEHQVELDRLREEDSNENRKRDMAVRTKLEMTQEMLVYRKVNTMWLDAGAQRGLPQECIDYVVKHLPPEKE